MPSKLLADLLRKNAKSLGKGLPIYRPANNKTPSKGYRYRLIIPDTSKKGTTNRSDHDIVLLPALSVPNEEQAKGVERVARIFIKPFNDQLAT